MAVQGTEQLRLLQDARGTPAGSVRIQRTVCPGPVTANNCGRCTPMPSSRFTNRNIQFWQAGVMRGHPNYREVAELRDQAHNAMLRTRRLYWEYVQDHGCRVRHEV